MSSVDDKHAANVAVAREWWSRAPRRRLLGDHLSLNAVQQARMNGCELPWPATYDVPGSAKAYTVDPDVIPDSTPVLRGYHDLSLAEDGPADLNFSEPVKEDK